MSTDLEEQIKLCEQAFTKGSGVTTSDKTDIAMQLWELAKLHLKQDGHTNLRAHNWFNKNVKGIPGGSVEILFALRAFGDERLLEEIDSGRLSLYQARNVMVLAKDISRMHRLTKTAAVTEALKRDTGNVDEASASTSVMPEEIGEHVDEIMGARAFHKRITELANQYVGQELKGLDVNYQRAITEEFAGGIRVVYENLLKEIRRHRRDLNRSVERVSADDLSLACEWLGIKVPAVGAHADMNAARAAHRRLSAQLHPDRRESNNAINVVQQYTSVQEAWKVLQDYERQLVHE